MRIDITSMFFNSSIEGQTATPAWGTSIGQSNSRQCRIDDFKDDVVNMLVGMTYKSITNFSELDASKGSKDTELLIASVFDDIYVNDRKINDSQFTLLLVREHSKSHEGRLLIKYAPYITYKNLSNNVCIEKIRTELDCSEKGCWYVYDISIVNQSQLHFKAIVLDKDHEKIYDSGYTSKQRSTEWKQLIPDESKDTHVDNKDDALQQIFYGAPGTGKSHKIKDKLESNNIPIENIFRTTFHPDSDYSTFVGTYKPTMQVHKENLYTKEQLINKLTEIKEKGVTYCPHKFGAKYWFSLKQLTLKDKKDILTACDMSDNYTVEIDKGIAIGEDLLNQKKDSQIVYSFVPQTFTKAYIQAYKNPTEEVYLIIEEINRGNCAQIFGDLFQLLDRDEHGKSEYTIKADTDLQTYLEEKLGKDNEGIRDGELCLPPNLYIYATMNTSDQSLFPIDSAFKRRWDWKYIPISYKNTDWIIDIDGTQYSWVSFQEKVNNQIFDATHSEDKMLGDYFVNPLNKIIDKDLLLDKILFYLWNDVCKDGDGDIFKTDKSEDIKFSDLYGFQGTQKLLEMMKHLNLEPISVINNLDNDIETSEAELKESPELADWYEGLWKDVKNELVNLEWQNPPIPTKRSVYQSGVGLTGLSVLSCFSKRKGLCYVGYYIEKAQAESIYPKLQALKEELEIELGELEWEYKENSHAVVKVSNHFNDIDTQENRDRLIRWVADTLNKFNNAMISKVDQLR